MGCRGGRRARVAPPALLLLLLLLSACSGDAPGDTAAAPAQLCVSSECGSKTRLVDIPDAENILFTPDGRLFVSGGENVYEVTRDAETWQARPLLDGSCNFTGLAQRGDVLYAACFSGTLYAATLDAEVALQAIHTLEGFGAANGMSVGPQGELYVVNGPLSGTGLPDPKIARLLLAPGDPFQVVEQSDWLVAGLEFPNGLTRIGSTLYFTDSSPLPPTPGYVKTVEILADGSAGTPQTLATLTSLPDDLSVAGDHLLVSLFSEGAIALIAPDGSLVAQTDPMSFESPSSVRVGQAPLFAPTDLLVTEKGVLQEGSSPVGNALSVFRPQ